MSKSWDATIFNPPRKIETSQFIANGTKVERITFPDTTGHVVKITPAGTRTIQIHTYDQYADPHMIMVSTSAGTEDYKCAAVNLSDTDLAVLAEAINSHLHRRELFRRGNLA